MLSTFRPLAITLLFLLAAVPLRAEFYELPPDTRLVSDAMAIAVGTVTAINPELRDDDSIVTRIDFRPEIVLKGKLQPLAEIDIVEPGGIVGDRGVIVGTFPTYWVGNRALVFLIGTPTGEWRTYGAALGKFDFVFDASGRQLAVRWATGDEELRLFTADGLATEELVRDADLFLEWIARAVATLAEKPYEVVHPEDPEPIAMPADYVVEEPVEPLTTPSRWDPTSTATYPPSAYVQGNSRWDVFDKGGSVSYRASGSQPGYDYVGAAQRALAAWTNDAGSNVVIQYAGTTTAGFVLGDSVNAIVYSSSADVPSGALAYAQWSLRGTHTYKGETFYSIGEGDVVMKSNPGISQKVFDEAITHEVGHTLGFRHSDQGTPASNSATMRSVLTGSYGAALGPWDVEAVRTVYAGTTTTPPPAPTPPSVSFTDDPLRAGITVIKAAHLTELRTAVNRWRAAAGLAQISNWTDPSPRGIVVKAIHITELQNALRPALQVFGRSTTFTSISQGMVIRAAHFQELRNRMK